jgi:hypothetical protein
MLVIKQKYRESVPILKHLYEAISGIGGPLDQQMRVSSSKLRSNRNIRPEEHSEYKHVSHTKRSNQTSKPARINIKIEEEAAMGHSHYNPIKPATNPHLKRNKTIEFEASEEVPSISKLFHSNRKYHNPKAPTTSHKL